MLRLAQMPQKTKELATLLAVFLFAERTEQTRFVLSALFKEFCWQLPNHCDANRDSWRANVQLPAS